VSRAVDVAIESNDLLLMFAHRPTDRSAPKPLDALDEADCQSPECEMDRHSPIGSGAVWRQSFDGLIRGRLVR
jgi:hypothetical protein